MKKPVYKLKRFIPTLIAAFAVIYIYPLHETLSAPLENISGTPGHVSESQQTQIDDQNDPIIKQMVSEYATVIHQPRAQIDYIESLLAYLRINYPDH